MSAQRAWAARKVCTIALLGLAFALIGSAAASSSTVDTAPTGVAQFTSAASGNCSKAEAIDAVRRLGLSDISQPYVWKVLCGAFTGAGSQTMVASINGDGNVGMLYWAVFTWTGSEWQFLMKQRHAATLTAVGSDIRETRSIYRPGDSRCCPSGGTKSRIWHWNGTRFVAGPWGQARKAKSRGFWSPSHNIACGMFDDSSDRFVYCQSIVPPQTVRMNAAGRLKICRDPTPNNPNNDCNIGNPGEGTPTLAYGKQITVGRFRCVSLQIGVKCTVIQSGNGFLINRDGVVRVGM